MAKKETELDKLYKRLRPGQWMYVVYPGDGMTKYKVKTKNKDAYGYRIKTSSGWIRLEYNRSFFTSKQEAIECYVKRRRQSLRGMKQSLKISLQSVERWNNEIARLERHIMSMENKYGVC